MTIRGTLRAALLPLAMTLLAVPSLAGPPVTLYYFHRDIRCTTCVALGDMASWVAEVGIRDRIASGDLAFRMVNYQSPGNEHFADEFDLEQPSAVLVASRGDSVVAWRNLERIWELAGDSKALESYLTAEVRAFLGAHAPCAAP